MNTLSGFRYFFGSLFSLSISRTGLCFYRDRLNKNVWMEWEWHTIKYTNNKWLYMYIVDLYFKKLLKHNNEWK